MTFSHGKKAVPEEDHFDGSKSETEISEEKYTKVNIGLGEN